MLTNLYTPTGTYAQGETNAMNYCALGAIDGSELVAKNLTDPYLMGYVPPERMPGYLKIGHPVNDGRNFHVDYIEENHGWGFAINPGGNVYSADALSKSGTLVRGANNYAIRMINTGFMSCLNCNFLDTDNISIQLTGIAEPLEFANDNLLYDSTQSGVKYQTISNLDIQVTVSDLINVIKNNAKITFTTTFNILGKTRTFSFNDNDCNEYGLFTITDSLNEITLFFNLTRFYNVPVNIEYTRDPTNASDIINAVPFFQSSFLEDANSNLATTCKIATCSMNSILYGSLRLSFDTSSELLGVTWSNFRIIDRYFIGNIPYNVNLDEIFSAYGGDYTPFTTRCAGVVNNKFIYINLSNTQFDIFPTIKLKDIYNNFILLHKRTEQTGQTYAERRTYANKAYVTLFDDENVPLYETENGTATDPDFMAKLQPWQYPETQITINEFSPEDIPEYNPEPGENGENVGDDIIRPLSLGIGGTNGFVTQYALRAADIQELGEILWTSVFDSDYWQNYMFSLALDTGSFSTSSMLSFFISLKVYPFALMNVPSYTQIDKNIYIGTGIHAIELTNNLHTINNYCDYIPGGECTVWSGNFYNDFRDYVNATYTLYVPYCGTIELNPGDVVHSKLTVQYAVDFATGGCVAYVDVLTQDGKQFPVAALPGQIGADIPLTATAAGAVAARFVGDAMKFGGLISGEVGNVAGGIAAGMAGKTPTGGGSGNVLSGMAGVMGGLPAAVGMDLAPGVAMQAANIFSRGAVSAPMMSGGQGFASFGAPQKPYLQIRRGIYPEVSGLANICGSRGAGTYTIGDLSGFVQGDVKTDGLNCPENEQIKIRQLIARGIYV